MDGRGGYREGAGQPKAGTDADRIATAYRKARASREAQRARIAELNLKKLEGSLVDADGVRRGAYAIGQYLQRNLVDVLPASIAVELSVMTKPRDIETFLRERMRAELDALGDMPLEELQQTFGEV